MREPMRVVAAPRANREREFVDRVRVRKELGVVLGGRGSAGCDRAETVQIGGMPDAPAERLAAEWSGRQHRMRIRAAEAERVHAAVEISIAPSVPTAWPSVGTRRRYSLNGIRGFG